MHYKHSEDTLEIYFEVRLNIGHSDIVEMQNHLEGIHEIDWY